ncbi:MAG: ABC transporter substrate-binding protein [Rubricella sp.]
MRKILFSGLLAAMSVSAAVAEEATLRIGFMSSHQSEVAPISRSFHDGLADFVTLVTLRDGAAIEVMSCETNYTLEGHVACAQELVGAGAHLLIPTQTEGAYALNRLAPQLQVPVMNGGLGQTATARGELFPWSFVFPANYPQAAAAMIGRFGQELGGLEGRKIGFLYHDSPFGQEPIPVLQAMATRMGFELVLYPVEPPGEDQRETWGRIARDAPDRLIVWTVGRMTATAVGTAAAIDYPRENMMGIWWTTIEPMMRALGDAADGMRAVSMTAVGHDVSAYNDLNELVYFAGLGHGTMNNIGDVDYNRGLVVGAYLYDAYRDAAAAGPLTGATFRDALARLTMTEDEIDALGLEDLMPPIAMTCADHSGEGLLQVIRWNADFRRWQNDGDYVSGANPIVDAVIGEQAAFFAREWGLEPSPC